MTVSPLAKTPVIRILIPFIAGILCHELLPGISIIATAMALLGVLLAIVLPLWSRDPLHRLRMRPFFSIPLILLAMSLGWWCSAVNAPKTIDLNAANGKTAHGRIESICFKEYSSEMEVLLTNKEAAGARIKLTTQGCDYRLEAGDLIAFKADLSKIVNNNCDEDINFAQLLRRKGIIYQQHIRPKRIIKYGKENTVASLMAAIRNHIQSVILNSDMSATTKGFVISLVLGDKKMIDSNTRYEYSCAGVAHILALSGLHIGILALIIWLIFKPLDYCRMRKVRLLITIIVIFAYVLLTGMSPSVVRASIMIGFTFLSFIIFRRTTPLNALLSAALLILLFNPQSLFNVGFQLSFITVASLLITAPIIKTKRIKSRKRQALHYLYATCFTSAIAMLATIALSAFYFHTTSWISILTNLLILPVFPLFMMVGIFIVALAALNFTWPLLNSAAELLVSYFNTVVSHITRLPLSHTDNIYITGWEVAIYYIFFAFLILALLNKKWIYGILSCGALACGIAFHAVSCAFVGHEGIAIFSSFSHTSVFYHNNNVGFIWAPDDQYPVVEEDFRRQHKGFLARHSIDSLVILPPADTIKVDGCLFKPPFAFIKGTMLMIAGNKKWKQLERNSNVTLNYCIIGRHFHGTISDLQRIFTVKHYILSGKIYEPNEKELIHQLDSLQLPYTSLRSSQPTLIPIR